MRLPMVLKVLRVAAPLYAKHYQMLDGYVDPTADRQLIAQAVGQVAFEDGYKRALADVERMLKPTRKRKSKR